MSSTTPLKQQVALTRFSEHAQEHRKRKNQRERKEATASLVGTKLGGMERVRLRLCPPPTTCRLFSASGLLQEEWVPGMASGYREGGLLRSPDSLSPEQDQRLEPEVQGLRLLPAYPEVKVPPREADVGCLCVVGQSLGPV